MTLFNEYEKIVSYKFFKYYFKKFNISFGFPRADICIECELFDVKIKSLSLSNNNEEIFITKKLLEKHQFEAQMFYNIKKQVKNLVKIDSKVCAISLDYEKNLPLPVTNVSSEYYMRQLWNQNFCIHNFKDETPEMFIYSEHFAGKSLNEVITFINFFIEKLNSNIKTLYVFSDNAFFQCENRYNWMFYFSLIKNEILDEVIAIHPIPGHSYLECDRNFARIEKNRLKLEKVNYPSEYVNLIKETDKKFNINFVNYPLTDDLKPNGNPIITVKDYKKYFEGSLVANVEHLSQIRKIKFSKKGIFATTDLLSEDFDLTINLLKPNLSINKFNFESLQNAYQGFRPIKQSKFNDVKKLLQFVVSPENVKFYDSIVTKEDNIIISKSKIRAQQMLCENSFSNCKCKGKCLRFCECKKFSKFCNEKCLCNSENCRNK